jgi:hypothetical protein
MVERQADNLSVEQAKASASADSVSLSSRLLGRGTQKEREERDLKEDQALVRQVVGFVDRSTSDQHAKEARLAFVDHCYGKRLRTYRNERNRWRSAMFFLGLTVGLLGAAGAVAGALGKGVGQGSGWSIVGIAAGALVTVFSGLARTWKPEERFAYFDLTRARLRSEGWDYVQGIGSYEKAKDVDAAYVLFAKNVGSLIGHRSVAAPARSR